MRLIFVLGLLLAGLSHADMAQVEKGFKLRGHFGLLPHPKEEPNVELPRRAVREIPQRFSFADVTTLPDCYDQGQCGSCVYNAFGWANELQHLLLGSPIPRVSRQHIMDCRAREWMCNGSYMSKVAGGVIAKGGLTANEADYAYRAVNQSCKGDPAKLYGSVKQMGVLQENDEAVVNALLEGHVVMVTVGAGGKFMNPGSNGEIPMESCSNVGTNHQVVTYGYECKGPVEFDSKGNFKPGLCVWLGMNSWGKDYGNNGAFKIAARSKSGGRCFNYGEESTILKLGVQPKPVEPVTFSVESRAVKAKATWKPGAPFTVEQAKKRLQDTANMLGEK